MKKSLCILLSIIFMFAGFTVVSSAATVKQLDLVFVVDTTYSMNPYINELKSTIDAHLNNLDSKGIDYRVAVVDYRDFSDITGVPTDYPYKVQTNFTNDRTTIVNTVNNLKGIEYSGGDVPETASSAMIKGINELSWREKAGKAVIIISDAPIHEKEPKTGYTKEMVLDNLQKKGIKVYSITVINEWSGNCEEVFKYWSNGTSGVAHTTNPENGVTASINRIIRVLPSVAVDVTTTPSTPSKPSTSSGSFFDVFFSIIELFISIFKIIVS